MRWLVMVLYGFSFNELLVEFLDLSEHFGTLAIQLYILADKYDVPELQGHARELLGPFKHTMGKHRGTEIGWGMLSSIFSVGEEAAWAEHMVLRFIQADPTLLVPIPDLGNKLLTLPRLASMLALSGGIDGTGFEF